MEEKINTAKAMKEQGLKLQFIANITGLSLSEIEAL